MATITLSDLTRLPIQEQIDLSQKLWLNVEREMDANYRAANGCTCPPSHPFGRLPPDHDYSLPYPGLEELPLEERLDLAMALSTAVAPAMEADPSLDPFVQAVQRAIEKGGDVQDPHPHPQRLLTEAEFGERLNARLGF
ncbi:MAG TPA: hypothetical protein VFQ45_21065 [Longimicrobium sp.]|nr:hypothetical protein [Longimicrobium sp.]